MNLFNPKPFNQLSIGVRGEKAAAAYLKKCGYLILATNFTNETGKRLGEIDIIAKDGAEIVFVEVKTRSIASKSLSLPEENITRSKLYKLNKVAAFYLSKNKLTEATYRFDAISFLADPENKKAHLRHLKNIFF